MAIQTIAGGIVWPRLGSELGAVVFTTNNYLIDAASEKAGTVFQAPFTGTITAIAFRTGTVTTGATLDVRLETVDASANFPSGTLAGTNTNGSQVVADTDDNTYFIVTLTSGYSATRGELLAVVISNPASSFGNMQIVGFASGVQQQTNIPFGCLYTTSWASVTNAAPLLIGVSYSGTYYGIPNVYIASAMGSVTFNSSSNPNHRGLRFQVPFTCSVNGFMLGSDLDGDADILLVADNWDGNSANALSKLSLDKDIRKLTSPGSFLMKFPSDYTLVANTTYRLIVKPTTTTSLLIYTYTVADAAQWNQTDAGTEVYYTTANNPTGSGDWTDTTTQRPIIGLMLNGFDDGAGAGGGLLTNPGMGGGIRG